MLLQILCRIFFLDKTYQ